MARIGVKPGKRNPARGTSANRLEASSAKLQVARVFENTLWSLPQDLNGELSRKEIEVHAETAQTFDADLDGSQSCRVCMYGRTKLGRADGKMKASGGLRWANPGEYVSIMITTLM
ncbi:hypothetical protein E4U21_001574 [Claviceps maximensis]|nr:hypothetical protein E4U21_001574 [Claviceps maximensis]